MWQLASLCKDINWFYWADIAIILLGNTFTFKSGLTERTNSILPWLPVSGGCGSHLLLIYRRIFLHLPFSASSSLKHCEPKVYWSICTSSGEPRSLMRLCGFSFLLRRCLYVLPYSEVEAFRYLKPFSFSPCTSFFSSFFPFLSLRVPLSLLLPLLSLSPSRLFSRQLHMPPVQ